MKVVWAYLGILLVLFGLLQGCTQDNPTQSIETINTLKIMQSSIGQLVVSDGNGLIKLVDQNAVIPNDTNTVTAGWTGEGGNWLNDFNVDGNLNIGGNTINFLSDETTIQNRSYMHFFSDIINLEAAVWVSVFQSNLIPDGGNQHDLGNVTNYWRNLFVKDINARGDVNASGTIRATSFEGDGSKLTGIVGGSGKDTNVYTAGILAADYNSVRIDWNMGGNDIINAKDLNGQSINAIAPAGISATTPIIHAETDDNNKVFDLLKLDINKNGFRLYHGTRPTHMAGMDVTSDPKNMASSATYIHGTSSGRIYVDCLTTAGASGTCYSMEFTKVSNFVDLPSRMLQNVSTTDTSMCSTGVACSAIGGANTVDFAHVYQAAGYMSARGNQTTGQPAVKWKSFASDLSAYNSQAYYSNYSYDTNSPAEDLTTLSHTKWLTKGTELMKLTHDGNLNIKNDLNIGNNLVVSNKLGLDYNMGLTNSLGEVCFATFTKGVMTDTNCGVI